MEEYELIIRASDGSWKIEGGGLRLDILTNINNSLERRLRRHLDESILQDLSGQAGR